MTGTLFALGPPFPLHPPVAGLLAATAASELLAPAVAAFERRDLGT